MERQLHRVRQVDGRLGDEAQAHRRPRLDDNRARRAMYRTRRLHRYCILYGELRTAVLAAGWLPASGYASCVI